jgi:hypothetical protein
MARWFRSERDEDDQPARRHLSQKRACIELLQVEYRTGSNRREIATETVISGCFPTSDVTQG